MELRDARGQSVVVYVELGADGSAEMRIGTYQPAEKKIVAGKRTEISIQGNEVAIPMDARSFAHFTEAVSRVGKDAGLAGGDGPTPVEHNGVEGA